MRNTAVLTRGTVAAALALCALATVVSVVLMPDFSGGHAERLEAIAAAPGTSTASALLFTLAQLPFAVGLAGVAHLIVGRAPVLAAVGAVLVVLGGFGHAVYGGVNVVMLSMAQDLDHLAVHAQVLSSAEAGVGIPFMAMGLLGTAVGLVVLGVGVWRARFGPRWLGPALVVFVLTEFGLSGTSAWAGYASAVLYLAALGGLAVVVARSSLAAWVPAVAAGEPVDVPA